MGWLIIPGHSPRDAQEKKNIAIWQGHFNKSSIPEENGLWRIEKLILNLPQACGFREARESFSHDPPIRVYQKLSDKCFSISRNRAPVPQIPTSNFHTRWQEKAAEESSTQIWIWFIQICV